MHMLHTRKDTTIMETFSYKGRRYRLEIEPDHDAGAPWETSDGHGPVTEWTSREKRPGERVIATDRTHKRFYDYAEAVRIARRDQWGTADGRQPGETAGAYAARAVEADYQFLRGWCRDEWSYVGV